MLYERDTLLNDLKEHVAEVTFTKVNGEKRVMRCTLRGEHLPQNSNKDYLEEQHKKPENQELIVAWDLHNNGWRSFRISSVEYVQIIDGY
jgi:hypothetical protein